MDPVSHVAFGRTLMALDTHRTLGRGAIAACVLGSLTPDLDAVFMPIGWDLYLRHHQGGTHSLIGSIACAALTAAVVRIVAKRGDYLPLWLAAWAGTAGHLVLDVISGADVRFFWPLGPPVALPLFAMADPWLGGVFMLGLVTLALRRRNSGRIAAGLLVAVTALAAGKAVLYAKACTSERSSSGSVEYRRADAEWGSLVRWITYETRGDVVEARRVDALTGTITPLVSIPRGLDDPLVVRSRELKTVQNFLAAHGVTFAIVIGAGVDRRQVLWSDLRYCSPVDRRTASWPPWAPADLGSGLPVSCTLWFGGEFDPAAGRPAASIVHVGHLVQRRPIR
jgi:membrane-bound metal-dependent hydrolase YbcI (DUF457 family)